QDTPRRASRSRCVLACTRRIGVANGAQLRRPRRDDPFVKTESITRTVGVAGPAAAAGGATGAPVARTDPSTPPPPPAPPPAHGSTRPPPAVAPPRPRREVSAVPRLAA